MSTALRIRTSPDPVLNGEDLVRSHSEMVRRIAWQVHSRMSNAIDIADLVQIGIVALLEAGRSFEDRGMAFAPYAAVRVKGAMIDELRRHAGGPRAAAANRRKLAGVRASLEHRHCREVSHAEMAEALDMGAAAYHNMILTSQAIQHQPFDQVYSDEGPWFADPAEAADTQLEQSQMRDRLAGCIERLPPREALVLQLYFVEELNLVEIGHVMEVGAARVCQIKRAALERLREMLGGGNDDC